jgi:hypothetical protein
VSHGGPTGTRNSFAVNEESQPSSSKRPSVKAADRITFCSGSTQPAVNSRRLAGKKTCIQNSKCKKLFKPV